MNADEARSHGRDLAQQLHLKQTRRKRQEKILYAAFILIVLALVATWSASNATSWRPFAGRIIGVQITDDGEVLVFRAKWGGIRVERAGLLDVSAIPRYDDAH
jgi:hypothetical protein